MNNVLIAEDDKTIVEILTDLLKQKGLSVTSTASGDDAIKELASGDYDLALLDINLEGKSGIEVLKETSGKNINTISIVMTADNTMTNTIEAMKHGAFDYISKPFDLDELDLIIDRAKKESKLKKELKNLKTLLKDKLTTDRDFIGKNKKIQDIFKQIGKISMSDATVLILGESGTGKELLARLIHNNSNRSDGPFVAVNAAAIPKDLLESELFGHEKGAFTGASSLKEGKFELAQGGTLFLDEIGDMTLDLQSKLLRAIQEREFYRVGGEKSVTVDLRIVAATNIDLKEAVEEKRFREDLYYRLNVVNLELPPLRERSEDIKELVLYFTEKFSGENDDKGQIKKISKKAMRALISYNWPGNVRELENVIKRAVILSTGIEIDLSDLSLPEHKVQSASIEDLITKRLEPIITKMTSDGVRGLHDLIVPYMEKPLITLVLEKTNFNQVKAADVLGINRNTLRKKIKDLKINIKKGRS